MRTRHHRSSRVLLGITAALVVALLAILHKPARVAYHRVRLRNLHSYEAVVLTTNDTRWTPKYWRWRILERGRSQEQQLNARGADFARQIEALVELGYYERHEFHLQEPLDPFRQPEWLVRLAFQTAQRSTTNRMVDWPQIGWCASPSNTLLVRITAPVPVIREWQSVIRAHTTPP